MSTYEVQTLTVVDGWDNCWTEDEKPMTFPSAEEAQAAIDEFFDDLKDAGMADDYDREDYRVVRK
jgi:hypothetical protein